MVHRRGKIPGSNGNGDPFRAYVMRAFEELLAFAKRSERRWEQQEQRWKEQEQRWKEDRLERLNDREDFVRILQKIERRIDEGTVLTVAALKQVTAELKGVGAELRALRRRPDNGADGNGRRR